MPLNVSKYGKATDRDEWEEDDEWDKMSFNNPRTAEQFEAREIEGPGKQPRQLRSYQNGQKMDEIRPQRKPRGVRDW